MCPANATTVPRSSGAGQESRGFATSGVGLPEDCGVDDIESLSKTPALDESIRYRQWAGRGIEPRIAAIHLPLFALVGLKMVPDTVFRRGPYL
jgi:hypothetical protein